MTKIKILLSLTWLLVLPQFLFAYKTGDRFTVDGVSYQVINITNYTVSVNNVPKGGDVVIPATVFDGIDHTFTVVQIGGTDDSYTTFRGVTSITLPNTITKLDAHSFQESSITTLHIPASVKIIEDFVEPYWMERFGHSLPSTLESITVDPANPYFEAVDGVLYTKGRKELVAYPKAKRNLTKFVVPNTVERIRACCFAYNVALTSIVIPASVKEISDLAYSFAYGSKLTSFEVNPSNPNYKSVDGVLYTKDGRRLVCYPTAKGGSYKVIDSCKELAQHAFYNASITSIDLNQVEQLEYRTFYNARIKTINVSNALDSINANAFDDCKYLATFTVSPNVTRFSVVDGVLFSHDKKTLLRYPPARAGDTYNIPEGTTVINNNAFYTSRNLVTINVARSVTLLKPWSFRECVQLKNVIFPDDSQLNRIEGFVFWGANVLEELNFPASLEYLSSLGNEMKCLRKITFADGSKIRNLPRFVHESNVLSEVVFLGSTPNLTTIDSKAFYNNLIRSFTIPASVTTIGSNAFANSKLTELVFASDSESKLETIGPGAFANTAFTLTRIPTSVKSIGKEAFWNMKTAETINLSANIESISTEAFKGCYSLTALDVDKKNPNFSSIDGFLLSRDKKTLMICPPGKAQSSSYVLLPPSLTRIGDYAFYENSKLKSVVIPAKVTSLGKRAFGLCTALNRLVMLCDNPISGDSIAQKLNESTFDDGLTTPTDRRANITLSVRKNNLYDYFGDEYYLNFKSFTPSFDYAGGEYMELDTKKHMFVAPKNDDNTFVIPTSWGATNPDRVVAIADYAFENASSGIKEVVGPLYLEYIGAKAFMTNPAANSSSIENVFLLNGDYQGNKFTNSTYATTRFELDETGHDYSEFAPTTKVFLKKNVFHSTAFLFSSKRYLLDVKTSLGETVRTATPQMFDYRIPFQVNSTYSTFCREFPTDFSEFNFSSRKPDLLNVIAFTAGRYLKKQWLNGEQVNVIQMTSINEGKDGDGVVIPANTGVVIKTTDGKTPEDYFYQIYEDPTFETYFNEYDEATVVRGIVKRSQTVQPTEGNLVNFILSGDRVHRMTVAREIPVHRSYLQVLRGDLQDGAATIMKFFEGDDEELLSTGLETFEQAAGNDVIYDLQGLPVRQPRKGVYIKNGKKIVVK